MKYVLSVLTHGSNADMVQGAADSFAANVWPSPTASLVVQDGPCALPPATQDWVRLTLPEQQGFCRASDAMWKASIGLAANVGATHVFWLEHDFRFVKQVPLQLLADLVDADPSLAQMSLMRGAVNDEERAAGGVVGKHANAGSPFQTHRDRAGNPWLSHTAYFTTNPSVMTTSFMATNPWLGESTECEGKFGISLREHGYMFGVFGSGEPWVEHVGVRSGFGY